MTTDTYNAHVSFSIHDIIAVSCIWPAGSCGKEKVIFVCIFPVIFQVSLILCDEMAEHVSCALSSEMHHDYEMKLTTEQSINLKHATLILKRANSVVGKSICNNKLIIVELLHLHSVETENI